MRLAETSSGTGRDASSVNALCGGSSAASWLSMSAGPAKWPARKVSRCCSNSRPASRNTNRTGSRPSDKVRRYFAFNAEQATTAPVPFLIASSITALTAASGRRSRAPRHRQDQRRDLLQPDPQRHPGRPHRVVERQTLPHPGDALGGMQIVCVVKRPAEVGRERPAHGRLSAARHTADDDDEGPRGLLVNQAREWYILSHNFADVVVAAGAGLRSRRGRGPRA